MSEWILRAAGAVLILVSAGGWGMAEIRDGRRRLAELEAVLSLARHIRENIDRLSRPLNEIYAGWENPVLRENGFLSLLRSSGFKAAAEGAAWRISAEERSILIEFGEELGRGFREEQTALCRYAEDRLAEARDRLRAESGGRERLWRTIPLLSALALILMLL